MGEVGVDPELVAKAATALEQLRDALAANVPTIVNTMSGYDSGVNTGVLRQAQSRSAGDAEDMRARARLAELWEQQGVNILGQGLVDIPWSGPELDSADAKAEAQALAQAESSKDPKVAAASIQAIEQDLKDHMGDGQWLRTFYDNAAPYVAKLATTLHNNDGNDYQNRFTILTKSDQQILNTFATGLAAADKAPGGLSADAVQAIANAPDIWSAAMLIKFGPPGSSYATSEVQSDPQNPDGLSLLALLTDNLYRDEQDGKVQIPLGGPYDNYGYSDYDQLTQTLNDYDPLAAMLQADAQNKNAAWQVMGDTNPAYGNIGPSLAKLLLWNNGDLPSLDARFVRGEPNDKGQYPSYFTISPPGKSVSEDTSSITLSFLSPSVAGSFLDAATSAPRGISADAKYSAQAAVNIIDATPSPKDDDGVALDPALQQALTDTAQRYLLDLGMSATYHGPSIVAPPGPGGLPIYAIHVNGQGPDSSMSRFLEQIASNQDDLAAINAAAKVTFGNIYAQMVRKTLPPALKDASADDAMARLLGRIDTAANNDGIKLATDLDEQHEEYNKMLEFGEDTLKFLPVVGETADAALDPVKDALGLVGVPTEFGTGNAASTQLIDAQNFADNSTQIHISMVQGLLSNGATDLTAKAEAANKILPPDQQWLRNGQLVLTQGSYPAFDEWYQAQGSGMYDLDKLEATYGYLYTEQGATSSKGAPGPW